MVDVVVLHDLVVRKCLADGLTLRQVGSDLRIGSLALDRLNAGGRPDADVLVTLVMWLGVSLADVVRKDPAR
jgi:hypothetical protein